MIAQSEQSTSFLEVADRIGLRLCRDATWAADRCNWLGWHSEASGQSWVPVFRAQNNSLFDGLAGIALFLAWLYRFTEDEITKETAFGAVRQLQRALPGLKAAKTLGFHAGQAGIAHALLQVGDLLSSEEVIDQGLSLLAALADAEMDGTKLDVVSGSAGVIPVLLHQAERRKRWDFIETACKHGEHLLVQAQHHSTGLFWDVAGQGGQQNPQGYAHGASGIACAMLELYAATDDARYREAGIEGLRFERDRFNLGRGNEPGGSASDHPNFVGWAHGASSVGLARLRARQVLGDERDDLTEELDIALQATGAALNSSTSLAYGNFSLYHGAAGCADFLLLAGQLLDRHEFRDAAGVVGSNGIAHCIQSGMPWPCGSVPGRETPGLMPGLAGIGHFYLRLHAPEIVPSVLISLPEAGGVLRIVQVPESWCNGRQETFVTEESSAEGA